MRIPLKKADILLPKSIDMPKWSVVACDQYTSEKNYWDDVSAIVDTSPSTLNLVLPEIYLEENNVDNRIKNINSEMIHLLNFEFFKELKNSMLYLERTQFDGSIRQGIIAVVDLEEYSYEKGSQSLIRATEGTVLERIPPRVKVRENALLELPHIMLLIDDDKKEIIESLHSKVNKEDIVYDFDLMKNGGHAKGYKLHDDIIDNLTSQISLLASQDYFNNKYNVTDKGVLLFAVGDGNHSLATAKACYENLKQTMPKEEYENNPARYALVEIVNLHSNALQFEPIHRVVFNVNPEKLVNELSKYYNISTVPQGQKIKYVYKNVEKNIYITNPKSNLAVGSLQIFLDEYIAKNNGKIDYIHGDDVAKELGEKDNNIAFLLPTLEKSDLFKTVILDGALPRKTFSMGHSYDKRYYLECRKIK